MNYLVCVTVVLVGGGGKRCYNPCYNPCYGGMSMVYSQNCYNYHPVTVACNPIEVGAPVSSPKIEDAAPVSQPGLERDLAMTAADRPESLSQELGMLEDAAAVSVGGEDFGTPNGIRGFAAGDGGGFGQGGGFGFGNVNGMPRNSGTGSGSGQGDSGSDSESGSGGEGEGNAEARITVNVFTSVENVNNVSQTQTQNQNQSQWQTQNQNQNQDQDGGKGGKHCGCNGGEQVPLPPTVWMGFAGMAAAFVARRFGMVG